MNQTEICEKILHLDTLHFNTVVAFGKKVDDKYVLNGSGCRCDAKFLSSPLYRACVYLSILSRNAKEPLGNKTIYSQF